MYAHAPGRTFEHYVLIVYLARKLAGQLSYWPIHLKNYTKQGRVCLELVFFRADKSAPLADEPEHCLKRQFDDHIENDRNQVYPRILVA